MKRKALALVIGLTLLLGACSKQVVANTKDEELHTIIYQVGGTSKDVLVTYGNVARFGSAGLPVSSKKSYKSGDYIYISAQIIRKSVQCPAPLWWMGSCWYPMRQRECWLLRCVMGEWSEQLALD